MRRSTRLAASGGYTNTATVLVDVIPKQHPSTKQDLSLYGASTIHLAPWKATLLIDLELDPRDRRSRIRTVLLRGVKL